MRRTRPRPLHELRRALHHLYDPAALRQSALAELLGVRSREEREPVGSASLRRVLLKAIEALKPEAGVPPQANAWRLYHVLVQRFAEQFGQREAARDLALSIRQLRRQETLALGVLADHLWVRYGLASRQR